MKHINRTFKISLLAGIMILSLSKATAQGDPGIYLNGYATYVFDAGFDSYYDIGSYYDGKIKGGFLWGAGVEYRVQPEMGIELLYFRQDSNAPTEYLGDFGGVRFTDFDVAMNYIMLGGNRHIPIGSGNIEGDFGAMAGAAILDVTNPDNARNDSATKFAWGLRGGLTFWTPGRVGIKIQAMLLSPVQGVGGGLYFGTGGVGAGLSSYSSLYQFTLGGGLAIKLN